MGARVLDLLRVCGYIFCPRDNDDDDDDDADDACGKPVENYGNNRGDKKPIAIILNMCYHDCSGASKQINITERKSDVEA